MKPDISDPSHSIETLDALRLALMQLRTHTGPRVAEQHHVIRELMWHHIERIQQQLRQAA